MSLELNDKSALILDCMLNMPSVVNYDELTTFINTLMLATYEEIKNEWDSLCDNGVIVRKDYQHSIGIPHLDEVKNSLGQLMSLQKINANDIGDHIDAEILNSPQKQREYVALLGKLETRENSKYIAFSDYEWRDDPGPLCDELVRLRIMFLGAWASRKHSYRSYYLRQWPFDSYEMLSNIVSRHLKVEGLSDSEWHILFHLLLSRDLSLPYDTVKSTLELTEAELRECITILKEKGQVIEEYNRISLVKGAHPPMVQYFIETIYPRFRDELVSKIKRRVTEGLSNIYPYMCAKRLNELPLGETRSEGIRLKTINKSELGRLEDIPDLIRLGLALDLGDSIVLLVDVIKEIEHWVRGSLNTSLVLIPAEDSFLAHRTLKDIFSRCDTYVKIQDPYVGEDTFRILSSYVPRGIEIKILTGQQIGQGEAFEEISGNIARIKSERKGKVQIMFIGSKGKEAPFHDRFIISKNRCWNMGTSLKQLGKGKDSTIVEVPLIEKNEKIEPAFDWNWTAKKEVLETRGLTRLDFSTWKLSVQSSI